MAADFQRLELLFLGTGTSAGVPMIGCHCEVCTSTDPRDRRTRCSVVISHGPTRVLVDTTPELRLQAIDNGVDRIDAIVFTHAHADHIVGLDDVRRFNALKRGPLDVWASSETHRVLRQVFEYAWREPDPESKLFRPHLEPREINGPFQIDAMAWTPISFAHGSMEVLGFRVSVSDGQDIAYCTDISAVSADALEALRDLDTLVIDALQWRKHPTHLTIDEAVAVVAELKPRRAYFTHMSHGVMHARDEKRLPPGFQFAHDGLRVP